MLHRDAHVAHIAEERVLLQLLVLLEEGAVSHQGLEYALALAVLPEQLLAVESLEAVERPCQRKVLHRLAVAGLQVHALEEVEDIFELTVLLALRDDGFYGTFAYALDAAQAETDVALVVDGEVHLRLVHIGLQHLYAHRLALVHELRYLLDVVFRHGEVGSEELRGVVRLEVCRLVGYPRVAGSVRLVERIRGELLPVAPNLL